MFGISLSAMHLSFSKVLKFITTEIAPDVIKFPESNDEKDAMAIEFEEVLRNTYSSAFIIYH